MSKQTFVITADAWTKVGDGHTDVSFESYELVFADSKDGIEITESFIVQPTGRASATLRFDNGVWAKMRMSTDKTVTLLAKPSTTAAPYEQPSPDVRVTPGVQYAAGQSVGGILAMTGVMGTAPAATLISAVLRSKSVQTPAFKLYLFSKRPKTAFTDRGAIALDPVDAPLLLGVVSLANPDSALGISLYQTLDINLGLIASNTVFALLVPQAAVTFQNADDLSLELGVA